MKVEAGARYIVDKLKHKGFVAYLAGGCVRDFLLGNPSTDIDIATDAPAATVLELFPRTIAVGISFGVVIVVLDSNQYEVTSFRRDLSYTNGRKPDEIAPGTPEEDALRRDFTINGMFYDPITEEIYDFVGGKADLKLGIIRTIGNPYDRFIEDRLRMVRAVRFSAKFGFAIEEETHQAIAANAYSLFPAVAIERIWQEITKMAAAPNVEAAIIELHRLGLLQQIFPELASVHLNEIRHRVQFFHLFPASCPAILYIIHLFPESSFEELITLCRKLKCAKENEKWIKIYVEIKNLCDSEKMALTTPSSNKISWVNLYAAPEARSCLEVIAAPLTGGEKKSFLIHHEKQMAHLLRHISRVVNDKPLLTGLLLKEAGIAPGMVMGRLIKEGEAIAIEQDLNDPEKVILELKKRGLWP